MQNIGAAALFFLSSHVLQDVETRQSQGCSCLWVFCAILGGTITMVGSSPLFLLNDLIESSNPTASGFAPMANFSLFAVTPIGLPL
ncbi:MAG: hypothetical protein CM1200mP18_19190 [Gammaproteobacteria bacterium]|nr:MAG: hypothetical protein CM1200mP18_19190 [Gammaproteobacteria bacterium]